MWGRNACEAVYTGSLPFRPAPGRFAFNLASEAIHQLNKSPLTTPTNSPNCSAYIANYTQSHANKAAKMADRAPTRAARAGLLARLYWTRRNRL